MEISPTSIRCDGCGLPGSAAHVRERVERLERATRFRPIHINVLFVVSDPSRLLDDDFYLAPAKQQFFKGLLQALNIAATGEPSDGNAGLLEFQRRGFYLTYLSECPLEGDAGLASATADQSARDAISRLAPTLVTRIRFNYKPKHIVLLGGNLHPLLEMLGQTDLASLLVLDQGQPLAEPQVNDAATLRRFREVFTRELPSLKTFCTV